MLKILSTKQIREADRVTIENEPIASIDLMERAAGECVRWICERFDTTHPMVIFAGVGNNGGDALVIARRLLDKGYQVKSFVVRYSENFSEDLQINLDRLKAMGHEVEYILEESQFPSISSETVILDGLFGSGLNRKVEGLAALCIEQINSSIAEVIAIDMPSGMFADRAMEPNASVIVASHTLTFQVPKLAFFLPGNDEYTGSWHIIDIGLSPTYISNVEVEWNYVDRINSYMGFFDRGKFDHKGKFGHALLISGSYGQMGAAILASRAILRSGAGKLTAHIPHSGNNIMQVAVPEAMTSADDYDEFVGELPSLSGYSAVGIGPGIGKNKKTRRLLKSLLGAAKVPMVLDADALNLLAENSDMLKMLPNNSILTPHVAEFERMFGKSSNSYARLQKLKDVAQKHKCIIVLKGAYSAIAAPNGKVYFNATGNPGMATAGSGDVLTGIVTGFLSQVNDPLIATICAVYVHGAAGDLASKVKGIHGMVAGDIVDQIGPAMQKSLEHG